MLRRIRLHVEGQNVGSGLAEALCVAQGAVDHQMHVQRQRADAGNGLHHRQPDREIGNKQPVHDVYVDVVCPGGAERADIPLQIDEIGGQNGRRDLNHEKLPPFEIHTDIISNIFLEVNFPILDLRTVLG